MEKRIQNRQEELVREFQAGKIEVFDQIMNELQNRAFCLAYYWIGSRPDALDVVQEAFVRLWRVLPSWKPNSAIYTWLYRVIINLAKDRFREVKRKSELPLREDDSAGELSGGSGPVEVAMARETGQMIAAAVAALPPRQKEVFILRHYQDMPLKEIARIQGTSLGAAKANLFQALAKLKESLKSVRR